MGNSVNKNLLTSAVLVMIATAAYSQLQVYSAYLREPSTLVFGSLPAERQQYYVRVAQFYIENPAVTPEQSHKQWMNEKIADGWIYGPIKDQYTKEHPQLVEYDALPRDEQIKYVIFSAAVRAFVNSGLFAVPDTVGASAIPDDQTHSPDLPGGDVPLNPELEPAVVPVAAPLAA